MDPRAGALVAQHAVTVYGYRRDEAGWAGFFDTITAMRDGLLRRLGALEGAGRDRFDAEYRCIRLGDSLSLQFCNAWREPRETIGYRAAVRGSTLVISPDPFDGAAVPLQVIGRRIPARRVGSGDAGIDQRKRRRKHSFRTLNLLLPLFHFFTFPLRPTVP